jgi:response regulator RpfG family c-di-GMP phosphodiesterase
MLRLLQWFSSTAAVDPEAGMAEQLDRSRINVLFVDDEENILRSLTRLFMDEEFRVITAGSGDAALTVLSRTENVGVIISDQRMPGMSGAEFLSHARELAPDAVRMILTGYADVLAAMDAINKGGAARYLSKPWDDGQLLRAVKEGVDYYLVVMENRRLTALVKSQNDELAEWNRNLKAKVMEQTAVIRQKLDELSLRNQALDATFTSTIQALSCLVELSSPALLNHCRLVTDLAVMMARGLELTNSAVEQVKIGAQLHDIGLIGMPEGVLAKRAAAMSPEENQLYQQHPVRGQAILASIEALREPALLIRHHHESFNGSGFPDHLVGDAIPIGARIIGFADFIEREMRGKSGISDVELLFQRLKLHLGMQLDPMMSSIARKAALSVYSSRPQLAAQRTDVEYAPHELVSGMTVTRDVISGTGLLLIAGGTVLERHMIKALQHYYDIDPPAGGVFVHFGKSRS